MDENELMNDQNVYNIEENTGNELSTSDVKEKENIKSDFNKKENKIEYDNIQRQNIPPTSIPQFIIPQFDYLQLNSGTINIEEGNNIKLSKIIKHATPGSTIVIPEGEYNESLKITNPLKLVAEGNVKIVPHINRPGITILSEGVIIRGINISQQKESQVPAIYIDGNSSTQLIDLNVKSDNVPGLLSAGSSVISANGCRFVSRNSPNVCFTQNSSVTLELCSFLGGDCDGISIFNNVKAKLVRCVIQGFGQNGITIRDSASIFIEKTRISSCANDGICLTSNMQTTVVDSSIEGCGRNGISAYYMSCLRMSGSTIEGTYCCGLELRQGSAARLSSNTFSHCNGHATIYCDDNVQLDSQYDQIFNSNLAICSMESSHVLARNIHIKDILGQGCYVTKDASLHMYDACIERTDLISVVCVDGGNLKLKDSYILNSGSTGIYIKKPQAIQLIKTHVDSCSGNGIEIINAENDVSIENCNFSRNRKCGAIIDKSSVNVQTCSVLENQFSGFEIIKSIGKFSRCITTDNVSGGFIIKNSSKLDINNCSISSNKSFGLCLDGKSTSILKNSTIENNHSVGIAIVNRSFITLKSCAIQKHMTLALQVEGGDSRALVDKCNVVNNAIGVLVLMNGRVAISRSNFDQNKLHLEVRDYAKIKINDSKFLHASGDVSINLLSNTESLMEGAHIAYNDCKPLVCEGALYMKFCQILSNKCGAILYNQASAHIKESRISNNNMFGIYVLSGVAKISKSVVTDNDGHGIVIDQDADVSAENNEFKNNGKGDIKRE